MAAAPRGEISELWKVERLARSLSVRLLLHHVRSRSRDDGESSWMRHPGRSRLPDHRPGCRRELDDGPTDHPSSGSSRILTTLMASEPAPGRLSAMKAHLVQ